MTFFAVNRHAGEALETTIRLQGFEPARILDHQMMTHPDLAAVNTLEDPGRVAPRPGADAEIVDGALRAKLPPLSYQMMRLALGATHPGRVNEAR